MKQTIIVLGILIVTLALSGCIGDDCNYVQENTSNRLELRADNQFTILQVDGFSGIWCIDDNLLMLHPHTGGELVLIRDQKDFIDGDGDRWVRD